MLKSIVLSSLFVFGYSATGWGAPVSNNPLFAVQSRHDVGPIIKITPAVQSRHDVGPIIKITPAVQSRHDVGPIIKITPAVQSRHDVGPIIKITPAVQSRHVANVGANKCGGTANCAVQSRHEVGADVRAHQEVGEKSDSSTGEVLNLNAGF